MNIIEEMYTIIINMTSSSSWLFMYICVTLHCKYLYTLLQCIYYVCVVQKVLVELYVYKE